MITLYKNVNGKVCKFEISEDTPGNVGFDFELSLIVEAHVVIDLVECRVKLERSADGIQWRALSATTNEYGEWRSVNCSLTVWKINRTEGDFRLTHEEAQGDCVRFLYKRYLADNKKQRAKNWQPMAKRLAGAR